LKKNKKIKVAFSQLELQRKLKEDYGKSLTRQRLHQLRSGYSVRNTEYAPKLIEGKHYDWERGKVKYFENAIDVILDQSIKLNAA
jgi:hypothetical protein